MRLKAVGGLGIVATAVGLATAGPAHTGFEGCEEIGTCNQIDVYVVIDDSPDDPVTVSQQIRYTLEVNNTGFNATNVKVTDVLPPGVSFVSASSNCSNSAGTVTCDFGAVDGFDPDVEPAEIVVTANQEGTLSNTATVTGEGAPDGVPENNSDTEETTVRPLPSCAGEPATIVAEETQHAVQTKGTEGPDVIVGNSAPGEEIFGKGGADLICGGDGNDRIYGGDGPDELRGEAGSDRLVGERGRDVLLGGPDRDTCYQRKLRLDQQERC